MDSSAFNGRASGLERGLTWLLRLAVFGGICAVSLALAALGSAAWFFLHHVVTG